MHNEQYDFQMFTCNAHQISAEKTKPKQTPQGYSMLFRRATCCNLRASKYQLVSVHDQSHGIYAIFCPLFS